ncbi:MAG: 50S ribosomal protein L22 [Proteobacteria bacterium]|nr:50S ribosomal protein L22 [Pseudomonadota bacterium]
MGKLSSERRLADNEAMAIGRTLRIGAQKLNLVAGSIRGHSVEYALSQLSFSKRRIAGEVRKIVQSAVANAENNHDLDVDRLFIAEATVGRAMVLKRWRARARGRTARILKPFSNLTVVVREREELL